MNDATLFGPPVARRGFDPRAPHALVHVPTDQQCPTCGANVQVDTWRQDALLIHGGHGATERVERRHCTACGWDQPADRGDERPPRTDGAAA